jgi:hypothetical protein
MSDIGSRPQEPEGTTVWLSGVTFEVAAAIHL